MKKPYNIELSTERNQPVETNIKLCQGDNNITFNINISDFDLTGNTVKIVFTQSNGISVENSAIVNSDNKSCTYNIVGNELQSVGKVVADLKIYDSNNKRLSSACFIFYVELDSLSDGSFPPKSYSASLEKALEECKEATQAALDAIQKVVNIANNDAVTVEGFAWDARRGKAIRDDFNALNESLATYFKGSAEYATDNSFTRYPSDFLEGNVFNMRCVMGAGADITYFPTSNSIWYNVITFGSNTRCTQIAVCGYLGFSESQKIYMRNQHDNNVSAWISIN